MSALTTTIIALSTSVIAVAAVRPAAGQAIRSPLVGSPDSAARVLGAVRTDDEPRIDGRLTDAVWDRAAVATGFTQQKPVPGAPASERTVVRVLFTDDVIYVGARLHDTRPDSVVARLARRDAEVYSDWFYVHIDSEGDGRTAFVFGLNPAGVQRDLLRFDDTRSRADWDAVWDAAATVDSLGWTAELRIPLSQLRFPRAAGGADGERRWGINFTREIARRDETAFWAPIPPTASGFVSLFGELRGLRGIRPAHRLELRPYSAGRIVQAPGSRENPFYRPTDLLGSIGADGKYAVTSDFTLTATINPDFGQVEADPSQVNLTAFELWVPEQRPFFLEGADLFDTGSPTLFYSRRIGRAPQGPPPTDARHTDTPEATSIHAAAKLTGRTASGWSVGFLDAVTGREETRYVSDSGAKLYAAAEPTTNYAVVRVTRDFGRGQRRVGGILTTTHRRLDADRLQFLTTAAYAGGADGSYRFGGGTYRLDGALRFSHVAGTRRAITRVQRSSVHYFQRPDAEHLTLDTTRTSLAGSFATLRLAKIGGSWQWEALGEATSPGFEVNDLGFQSGSDQLLGYVSSQYGLYVPGQHLRRWTVLAATLSRWTLARERVSSLLYLEGNAQLQNFWTVNAWVQREFGGLSPDALRGGPALLLPGMTYAYLRVDGDRRRPMFFGVTGSVRRDDEQGGSELAIAPSLTFRSGARLEFSLRPRFAHFEAASQFVTRRAIADSSYYLFGRLDQRTASLTARLSYTATPTLSVQFYAQPFLSAGTYDALHAVSDPRGARRADRFQYFASAGRPHADAGGQRAFALDVDGDGVQDATVGDPSFNIKELRSNLVVRWEYRRGSTLFVVWQQGRTAWDANGSFDIGRDTRRLFRAPGTNVLLVKASYWLEL
jgi:hypothetical protein